MTVAADGTVRIDAIHERRTQLARLQRLGRGDQTLVANAELLVIVAAVADPPLRRGLIDRLLVAAWAGEMDGMIVLTKADMADQAEEPPARVVADYVDLGYAAVAVDARTPTGVHAVRKLLAGRLAAFAGHSGVGKSTLVNGLTGGAQLTGVVNDVIGRGRHTTTAARIVHGNGIEVIDTPGIRGFVITNVAESDLGFAFPEIAEASAGCRFRGCRHAGDAGCAVPALVGEVRLQSYRKLLAEIRGDEQAAGQ